VLVRGGSRAGARWAVGAPDRTADRAVTRARGRRRGRAGGRWLLPGIGGPGGALRDRGRSDRRDRHLGNLPRRDPDGAGGPLRVLRGGRSVHPGSRSGRSPGGGSGGRGADGLRGRSGRERGCRRQDRPGSATGNHGGVGSGQAARAAAAPVEASRGRRDQHRSGRRGAARRGAGIGTEGAGRRGRGDCSGRQLPRPLGPGAGSRRRRGRGPGPARVGTARGGRGVHQHRCACGQRRGDQRSDHQAPTPVPRFSGGCGPPGVPNPMPPPHAPDTDISVRIRLHDGVVPRETAPPSLRSRPKRSVEGVEAEDPPRPSRSGAESRREVPPVPSPGRVRSASPGGRPVPRCARCRKLGADTITQSGSPRGPSSPELGSRTP
jgi:hypothetical protein